MVHPAFRGAGLAIAAALLAGCSSAVSTTAQHSASPSAATATATATPSRLPSGGTLATVASGLGTMQSGHTWGIGSDGTWVWVYNGDTGVLKRVTAATGAVAATIQLRPGCGKGCGNVAVGNGAVWVANDDDGTVTRIDPSTNAVSATIHLAANAGPLVYTTPGAVWSANYSTDSYTRIDPRSNATTTLPHHLSAEAVTYAAGSVWLCDASNTPALTSLDPATLAVRKGIDVVANGSKEFCDQVAPLGSSLFVMPDNAAPPQVVDPVTGAGREVSIPGDPQTLRLVAGAADGTWLLDARQGIFRIDTTSGSPAALLALAGGAGISDDGHTVWVITADGTLDRVVPA